MKKLLDTINCLICLYLIFLVVGYDILIDKTIFLDRENSPITEVEPYIPFNINPSGMQPILTTSYLLAFPGILARLINMHLLLNSSIII